MSSRISAARSRQFNNRLKSILLSSAQLRRNDDVIDVAINNFKNCMTRETQWFLYFS